MSRRSERILKSIEKGLAALRNEKEIELEGSIGKLLTDEFVSGATFHYFRLLLSLFSFSTSTWSSVVPDEYITDYFFAGNIRGRFILDNPAEFIRKEKLSKLDIHCPQRDYDIRISLSKERPVVYNYHNRVPELVRLQQRWTFVYKGCWKYHLSKTATGKTKDAACRTSPRYEIELEILPSVFETYPEESDTDIAAKFLEKLVDLLARFTKGGVAQLLELKLERQWQK